jgi:hypothetical protein
MSQVRIQGCLLPDSSIEFILNRYAVSLHKTLKLHKFELLRRTAKEHVLGDDDAWKTAELYMIACRVSILEQREGASPVNWAL